MGLNIRKMQVYAAVQWHLCDRVLESNVVCSAQCAAHGSGVVVFKSVIWLICLVEEGERKLLS